MNSSYASLPLTFFKFWFLEAPLGIVKYFDALNRSLLELLSVALLLKTFFRPWKNEYRQGLVGFSIGFGMFIKAMVLVGDCIIFGLTLIVETGALIVFILLPILTILLLFLN